MAADLPVIKLVASKGHETVGDCAICALGTLSGRGYEEIVEIASSLKVNWRKGMYLTEIIKVAKKLDIILKRCKKFDLETDVGILDVRAWDARKKKFEEHVVVLYAGRLFDCDLTVWAPDAFVKQYKAKIKTLLRVD